MGDYERPECSRTVTRRARKEHVCDSCAEDIHAGETYEYTSGIWDGTPESFKWCAACVALMTASNLQGGDYPMRGTRAWIVDSFAERTLEW
jgi:hypothetical protein